MLKIIETSSYISEELIEKYSSNVDYTLMYHEENKYTIDSINEYLSVFDHRRAPGEIQVGVIKAGADLSVYHQNKLLKTFEDSDDDQIHLLFTTSIDNLLPTIISRGILFREDIEFKFVDSELHNFAKTIVYSAPSYDLLKNEDEIFRTLYKIRKFISNGNIDGAIIECSKTKFTKVTFQLFVRLIQNVLYEQKRLDLLTELFEVERQCNYQVNLNMQATKLLVIIKQKKEYYERSNWN